MSITDREKGLLILAAVVLLATFYYAGRIKPQMANLKALTEEVSGLEQKVDGTRPPRYSGDPEAAKKQLEDANAKLEQARQSFDALIKKHVDENSPQELEGLMLEILTLANAKHVTVDNSGAYTGSIADFGIATKEELGHLQTGGRPFPFRPLRNLSLSGDYPHIRNFVKELPQLRHEVYVLRFSIKADGGKAQDPKTSAQPRPLRAELVLAL